MTLMRAGAVPTRAALLVAALAACVPFLLPVHALPIPSFFDEWLGATLLLCAALLVAIDRTSRWTLPTFAAWLLPLVPLFALHALDATYPQLPLAWAAYVLLAVVAALAGRALAADLGEEAVVRALAWACVVGALLNAIVAGLQLFGVPDALRDVVATTTSARAVGQVGQANVLATYLMVGLAAVVFLLATGSIGWLRAAVFAIVIAWGAAASGSRLVLLDALWLVLATLVARRGGLSGRATLAAAAAAAVAVALQLGIAPLHEAVGWPVPATGVDRTQSALVADGATLGLGARLAVWQAALDVVRDAPWVGMGPGTLASELFARGLPDALAREGEVWASAHNVFLDVAVAGGVFAALALAVALLFWWVPVTIALLRRATPAPFWVVVSVGIVTAHAKLEAPLSYAHVLGFFAFVMGIAAPSLAWPRSGLVRGGAALVSVALVGMAGWLVVDYLQLDRVRYSARATFLGAEDRAADAVVLAKLGEGPLAPMADLWRFAGTPWRAADAGEAIALGARAVEFRPAVVVVAKQAAVLALAGYTPQADALVDHLVATVPWQRERIDAVLAELDPGDDAALTQLRERVSAIASLPGPR